MNMTDSQMIADGELLPVFRVQKTQIVNGKYTPIGEPEKFECRALVYPLNGRDLMLVPEGNRYKEQYWMITYKKLRDSDRVVRDGDNFEVQSVENWNGFYRARIMRIDVGPDRTP